MNVDIGTPGKHAPMPASAASDDRAMEGTLHGTAIDVRGLTLVNPAGRTLVSDASFSIAPGEVVVVIGPSGCGKTSLIRLLCGLLPRGAGWQVNGTLHWNGGITDIAQQQNAPGGMVFQSHALFDDLNAAENLRIVADHAGSDAAALAATGMLADIAPGQRVAACSGGQRQRLAIARTLLSNPALLVFDEPNAGLDIRASRALVTLIREACRSSGKAALIVAHHVDEFISLADRVLLMDPGAERLRALPPEREVIEAAMLALVAPARREMTGAGPSWARQLPRRPKLWWLARYVREYMWMLFAAPSMIVFALLGASVVGFVTVWFGFSYHSFGGYLRAILHDETLQGLGFVLMTVAVPFNVSILITARNSAIVAADLGNRVSDLQMEAMRNLRLPGQAYIIAAIMLSLIVGSLLLVVAALVAGAFTSLLTWHFLFPGQPTGYWQENFFYKFTTWHAVTTAAMWVTLKVTLGAVLGGAAAIMVGLQPARSPSEVSGLIATAIIRSTSLTLLVHAVLLVWQF